MIFCVSWLKMSCALSPSDPSEERSLEKVAVPSMESDIIKFFCIGSRLAAQKNTGSVRNYFVLKSRKIKTVKTVFAEKYCQEEKQEASLCFSGSDISKTLVFEPVVIFFPPLRTRSRETAESSPAQSTG